MAVMFVTIIFLSLLFISGTLSICSNDSALTITTPKVLEGLSGSCLLIPCSFRAKNELHFNGTISPVGVWIKNDSNFGPNPGNVVFNSSGSNNTYPMNITGDLRQNSCTTLFYNFIQNYTNTYFFRIETEPFNATADCDGLRINVIDSPPSPNITISGDLKEKESVSIRCSAWTPCPLSPPELTWSLQQDSQRQTETNPDGTFTSKIQENMTLSDTHDGSNITCSVRYPVDGGKRNKAAETNLTLSVSYAPKDTSASISPSGLVSAGSWVELSCSSRANPPVINFTWFRNIPGVLINVSQEKVYKFNATGEGEFYCEAKNYLGNQKSPVVRLIVKGSSDKKSPPWAPIIGGIAGIVLMTVLILTITCLMRRKRRDSSLQQNPTSKKEQLRKSTKKEEIHYGEFQFSNLTFSPPSTSPPEKETVYAQVQKPEAANPSTVAVPEDLSAQIKKTV